MLLQHYTILCDYEVKISREALCSFSVNVEVIETHKEYEKLIFCAQKI